MSRGAAAALLSCSFLVGRRRPQKAGRQSAYVVRAARAIGEQAENLAPVFRFGVVADVQYADRDDAYNFSGSRLRRYRQAKQLWEEAVQWWKEEDVAFVAQLGDFIDGSNKGMGEQGAGRAALKDLLQPLEGGPPALHLVGNHELYNFSRQELEGGVQIPGLPTPFSIAAPPSLQPDAEGVAYYSFSPCAGWRVCVLDPYDVSVLSRGGGRPGFELAPSELEPQALAMCQANNPNDITKEDFARGLPQGPARRWLPFNGALSKAQLQWLRSTLEHAGRAGEDTVLLSHVVLHPDATPGSNCATLLWNYDEVLSILRSAPRPPVAVLCGHAHLGSGVVDEQVGTHHLTLASPLEVAPDSDACAIVEAFADGSLRIRGRGAVPSATVSLAGAAPSQ